MSAGTVELRNTGEKHAGRTSLFVVPSSGSASSMRRSRSRASCAFFSRRRCAFDFLPPPLASEGWREHRTISLELKGDRGADCRVAR